MKKENMVQCDRCGNWFKSLLLVVTKKGTEQVCNGCYKKTHKEGKDD